MLSLVRPRYFVPIHGEYRQLARHARIAAPGVAGHERSLLAENGDVIRFDGEGGRIAGKVPAGRILIDGTRSGEVGDEVLRDRRHLAGDGLVVPVVAISRQSGTLEETPDVITRGFVLDARTEALLKEIPALLAAAHRGRQRRGADRSRADQGEDPRGPAAVLPQAVGAPAARAAGRHGDLTWPDPRLSRRVSEFVGRRALRRWRSSGSIALASYSAGRPGLVLQHRVRRSRRRISPGASARSWPSCRTSCSATPPT